MEDFNEEDPKRQEQKDSLSFTEEFVIDMLKENKELIIKNQELQKTQKAADIVREKLMEELELISKFSKIMTDAYLELAGLPRDTDIVIGPRGVIIPLERDGGINLSKVKEIISSGDKDAEDNLFEQSIELIEEINGLKRGWESHYSLIPLILGGVNFCFFKFTRF